MRFGKKIKVFTSDNAQELAFTDFLNNEGVLHQFSCVDRRQQHSVVEWKHQHLLNVAHALHFQSQMPISFWSECILTDTFLINWTPSPLISNETPHEFVDKKPVDSQSFWLSTLCIHLTSSKDKIPTSCNFLSYPTGMQAYKLYDL